MTPSKLALIVVCSTLLPAGAPLHSRRRPIAVALGWPLPCSDCNDLFQSQILPQEFPGSRLRGSRLLVSGASEPTVDQTFANLQSGGLAGRWRSAFRQGLGLENEVFESVGAPYESLRHRLIRT